MLVNNNNNNIFYRHFSFRLIQWNKKMEMRINVCCRYENMWWNMKFIYFKVCSRASKRHLYFRTNTKPGSEEHKVAVENLSSYEFVRMVEGYYCCEALDYIFCVLFVVITIVKFGVKVFIRGNPFYWVLITKKRSKIKTYVLVNCLASILK